MKFGSDKLETLRVVIPRELYENSTTLEFNLNKVSGGYAALAKAKLFPFQERMKKREGVCGEQGPAILETKLSACQPNPFSRWTVVRYQLAQPGNISLKVYDISGRVVRTLLSGERKVGRYTLRWDSTNNRGCRLGNGVYFLRLEALDFSRNQKVVLSRIVPGS